VVPSTHVVGAVESVAPAGKANANAVMDTASRPIKLICFMAHIVNRFAPVRPQCEVGRGNIVVTFIRNGVCWVDEPA